MLSRLKAGGSEGLAVCSEEVEYEVEVDRERAGAGAAGFSFVVGLVGEELGSVAIAGLRTIWDFESGRRCVSGDSGTLPVGSGVGGERGRA